MRARTPISNELKKRLVMENVQKDIKESYNLMIIVVMVKERKMKNDRQ